jgi:hypothetical protein
VIAPANGHSRFCAETFQPDGGHMLLDHSIALVISIT